MGKPLTASQCFLSINNQPSVQAHITGIRQECYLGDGAEVFYKFFHCLLILHNQVTQSGIGGISGCGNGYMIYTQDVFTNSIGCIPHAYITSRVTYRFSGDIHNTSSLQAYTKYICAQITYTCTHMYVLHKSRLFSYRLVTHRRM